MPIDPEELFVLLADDGSHLGFDAALAAVSEKAGVELSENDLAQAIFILAGDNRVEWLPQERQLRRTLQGRRAGMPLEVGEEKDLEPWLERYLWLHARSFYDHPPRSLSIVVENTARVNAGGGRWTRPDLSMVCISSYRYRTVSQFDLYSFELKMPQGCNLLAVHEALAHGAVANFAYLTLYLPADASEQINLPAMLEQAQRHGVGIIRMFDPRDFSTYTKLLNARRSETSPARIDGFIEERFTLANRLALRKWVRL